MGTIRLCENDIDRFGLLDDALEEIGPGRFHYLMLGVTSLGSFIEAAEISFIGLIYPVLMTEWHVNESEISIVQSLGALGMALGCAIGGKLSDHVGRKFVYQFSVLVSVICGYASASATSVHSFAVLRLLLGLGYGSNMVTSTPLLLESTPIQCRGLFTSVTSIAYTVGSTFMLIVSWLFLDDLGWQFVVRLSSLIGIPVVVLLFCVTPESIRFRVMKHQFEDAVKGMETLCQMNGKPVPAYFTVKNLQGSTKPATPSPSSSFFITKWFTDKRRHLYTLVAQTSPPQEPQQQQQDEKEDDQEGPKVMKQHQGVVGGYTKQVFRTLIPLTTIWFLNSFGLTILTFLPLQLTNAFPSVERMKYKAVLMGSIGEWIGTMVVLFFCTNMSRIREIAVGIFMVGTGVFCIGIFSRAQALIPVCIMMVILRIGINLEMHGLYTYSPEVFPTKIRGQSFMFCQMAHRFAPVVSPFLLTYLDDHTSFIVTTSVYGCFFFAASILTLTFLFKETNGIAMVESYGGLEKIQRNIMQMADEEMPQSPSPPQSRPLAKAKSLRLRYSSSTNSIFTALSEADKVYISV